jgi:hypothetical protein
MKVAVVILNYNSSDDCRKCVGFLKRQTGVELEVIIVDNSSRQDDADAVEALCRKEDLTFIAAGANRGYNAGNNIGLRYAYNHGYEYAMVANPDMEFPDLLYISHLANELDKRPDTVAIGSDIVTPEGVHQNPMCADGSWQTSFGWIKEIIWEKKQAKEAYDFIDNHRESHQCAKLSGCCLLVNLKMLASLGFFDEYPFLYCEEAIFAKQAEVAGMRMYYTAKVQAIHRHIQSAKGDPRPRFRQWLRSRLYFTNNYAGYSWYGRLLASLSWRTYLGLMIFATTIKRMLNKI